MNFLNISYLLCSIILAAKIGGHNCQDDPGEDSFKKQIRTDREAKPNYFNEIAKFLSRLMEKLDKVDRQLMENGKKLDNVDRQLTEISKWKNETASQLNAFFTKNYWINSPSGLPLDSVNTTETSFVANATALPEGITGVKEILQGANKTEEQLTIDSESHPENNIGSYVLNGSFNQSESPFILDMTTLPENRRGAIVFDGNKMSDRKRRFWVLEKAGTVRFLLEKNDLKPDSRLTISEFPKYNSGTHISQVFINSSTMTGREFTVSGTVVLVTMSNNNNNTDGTGLSSSFALRFIQTSRDTGTPSLPQSTFVTGEGPQVIDRPGKCDDCNHLMVISRASGRDFSLKIFDRHLRSDDVFWLYYFEDGSEKTQLKFLLYTYFERNTSLYRNFGRYSTVVVYFPFEYFRNWTTERRYELMIE